MVSGIPSVPAFALGLAAGLCALPSSFPAMMLGLGVYLPFYMSFTGVSGRHGEGRLRCRRARRRRAGLGPEERAAKEKAQAESGLVVSSGLLGGESIVGVLVALAAVATGLGA